MAQKTPRSDQSRIGHHGIGNAPLLDEEDLDAILKATGLELHPDVHRSKFLFHLNDIVARTILQQLTIRLDRTTLEKLKASINACRDISRGLVHSEFPPPLPPPEWLARVEAWIREAERGLAKRKCGGAPANIEKMDFLPEVLGLFHAGFRVEPGSTVSWEKTNRKGSAFRFLQSTRTRVRDRIAERGFSDTVPPEVAAKARWGRVEDTSLGKRIEGALRLQMDASAEEAGLQHERQGRSQRCELRWTRGTAWQVYSMRCRTFIERL